MTIGCTHTPSKDFVINFGNDITYVIKHTGDTISTEQFVGICNQAYDDTFTVVAGDLQSWQDNYSQMKLYSEKLGQNIGFRLYSDGHVSSDYISLKYQSEVEKQIEDIAEQIYGECKVFNVPIAFTTYFGPNTSFEEYTSTPNVIKTAVLTNSSIDTKDTDIELLRKGLEAAHIHSHIRIGYYEQTDVETINAYNIDALIFDVNEDLWGVLDIDDDYSVKSLVWDNRYD